MSVFWIAHQRYEQRDCKITSICSDLVPDSSDPGVLSSEVVYKDANDTSFHCFLTLDDSDDERGFGNHQAETASMNRASDNAEAHEVESSEDEQPPSVESSSGEERAHVDESDTESESSAESEAGVNQVQALRHLFNQQATAVLPKPFLKDRVTTGGKRSGTRWNFPRPFAVSQDGQGGSGGRPEDAGGQAVLQPAQGGAHRSADGGFPSSEGQVRTFDLGVPQGDGQELPGEGEEQGRHASQLEEVSSRSFGQRRWE